MHALQATATPVTWRRVALAMLAAGWGANQFAPMLLVYRDERGLSEQLVTAMFAAYVGGLVPALLAAAWVSQHRGKRLLVRISSVLMLVGSALLLLGADSNGLLFAGRIASGVGVGLVMAPGTAWVKELSAGLPLGTGARRSTVALTAGFGLGPMVAGVLAQWFPAPLQLTYAVHLIVQAVAAAIVWNAPELDTADQPTPSAAAAARHVMHAWFWKLIVPSAPWVFGAATVAFAVTPGLVGPVPGLPRVAAAGLTAGLTLGTSVLVQPSVRRHAQHDPGRTPLIGMAVLTLGMMVATAAALFPHPLWLVPAAVVLGAAHGLLVVGSITIVEHHTPPHLMAATTAVVYSLTYIGFLAPYAVSTASLFVPTWTFLAAGVGVAVLTLAWLWFERKDA
jgi:MFS family permease